MLKKFAYLAAFAAIGLAACTKVEPTPAATDTIEVVNVPADEKAAAREEATSQTRDTLPTPAKK